MTELERQLTEALKRLSAQPAGEANHGKESYKSNWDCTICVSCRYADSVPAALKRRGGPVKLRESRPLRARRFRDDPTSVPSELSAP